MRIVSVAEKLAYTSLLLPLLAVLSVRLGLSHFRLGLAAFVVGLILALIAITISAVFSRRCDETQRKKLNRAAFVSLPVVLAFSVNFFAAQGSPAIHEVSTDVSHPPEFKWATTARGPDDNAFDLSPAVIQQQQQYYPDLRSIKLPLPKSEAQTLAVDAAEALGWEVKYQQDGHVEATVTSLWFGFVDDVVIRIQATAGGSKIDLRSSSRVGRGDLGTNARRVTQFIELIENHLK